MNSPKTTDIPVVLDATVHTLDVQRGNEVTSYHGELLAIDSIGERAIVRFRADSYERRTLPPSLGQAPAHMPYGDFDVVVDGMAQYSASHCLCAYFAFMAGNSHLYLVDEDGGKK